MKKPTCKTCNKEMQLNEIINPKVNFITQEIYICCGHTVIVPCVYELPKPLFFKNKNLLDDLNKDVKI